MPTHGEYDRNVLMLAVGSAMAVGIIWFGYPLAVAALAMVFGRRAAPRVMAPRRVTVVIATLDSLATVRARVDDVFAADYPAELLDVVVGVDHQGGVDAYELLRSSRVQIVAGDAPGGKAATLNAAVRAAPGELLVFTDAAQRFERSTIRRLVDALTDPALGAVSGALHIGRAGAPASLTERYWRFEKWLRLQEARLHSTVGVTGAVYAMRRECWRPLPAGVILDDVYGPMDLVLRGFRVGFEPTAIAYDERHFPPSQELRRKARTLTGVLQLCLWLPQVLVPWRNPLWVQFLFHKLLRLATPYLLMVTIAAGGAWLATGAGTGRPMVGTAILLTLLAVAGLVVVAVPRARHAVAMAAAMQVAMVRATVNGLRGHWDVWSR